MIKYNDNTINDWDFGTSNLIKVYRNNAVCYYKITSSGGTSAQTPCYAVVDDITQYTDREFEDVFDNATEKWYKLNNLNQYEEYGVYGSGRTITTYEGKLTIDTESTPQPSRLPQGYTEVEYIRQNSNYNAYIDTGVIPYGSVGNSFEVSATMKAYYKNTSCDTFLSCEDVNSPYFGFGYRFVCAGGSNYQIFGGDVNTATTVTNNSDGTFTYVCSRSNVTTTYNMPISLFCSYSNSSYTTPYRFSDIEVHSMSITLNNEIVRNYVPAKRDSDNKYGLYDLITDTFYVSPNGNNFSGGSEVIPPPITTTYEYIYSGGSWVNVGEVHVDVWKTNTKMQFKFYSTNNGGGSMIGEIDAPDSNDCRVFFASTTAYFDYGSDRISWTSYGQKNTLYEYEYGNYYIKNMVTSSIKTSTTFSTNRTNSLYLGLGQSDRFRTYYIKIYEGNTLVKDFIPWTDLNGNYGLYDKVSLSVYNVVSGYGSLTGSSNVTDVEIGGGYEYPLKYVVREDPPNNVSFSSMTEAEEYECPWVGMQATIDGDRYVFSGDSISGYEWVYNPSRLPQGYTEVEYIQNSGTSYFNTNFTPNQDTRVVCDMQMVTASNYPRLWGAGQWNSATGLMIDYDSNKFQVSWFGNTSWTDYTSYPTSTSYYRHTYDLNKNYMYIDETLVGSNTYTTKTASDPIGIFVHIYNGRPSSSSYWGQEHFKGKMYSFQIYDNGTLVRDLVPCIRDNDNEVGAYDIVNDVFYTVPSGYTTDKLIAGPTV